MLHGTDIRLFPTSWPACSTGCCRHMTLFLGPGQQVMKITCPSLRACSPKLSYPLRQVPVGDGAFSQGDGHSPAHRWRLGLGADSNGAASLPVDWAARESSTSRLPRSTTCNVRSRAFCRLAKMSLAYFCAFCSNSLDLRRASWMMRLPSSWDFFTISLSATRRAAYSSAWRMIRSAWARLSSRKRSRSPEIASACLISSGIAPGFSPAGP